MKKSILCGILGLLAFVNISCKKQSSLPSSTEKTLIFARSGDSVGLDLARQEEGESINIAVNILETLVTQDPTTMRIVPLLAEKWDISRDGKSYVFHLRDGVQFQDGKPFNADAVLFSVMRQMDPQHPAHSFAAPYKYWDGMGMSKIIKEVKKIDNLTVEFILNEPNAPFLANVSMPFMAIVSPDAVLEAKNGFDQRPIGTGPYKLGTWKKDDYMELLAFDKYWGNSAHIKRVIVRVIPDNQVRLLELKKGAVHIMVYPNPSDVAGLKDNPDIKVLTDAGMNVGFLAFNMNKPPLDRQDIRQAISMAINRDRIISEIFQGLAIKAKNPMPPQLLGYNDKVPQVEYNPEKAKQLIEKSGLKNISLELWAIPVARPYNPNGKKMAEFMQADLKNVGIDVKIVSYDWGTHLEKIGRGEHQLVMMGWSGDNGDPDNFLYTLWSKDAAMVTPTQNYAFYKSDIVNDLLIKAQRVSNPLDRSKLYFRALDQMAIDRPFLPLVHSEVIVPVRKEVEGYVLHPRGDRLFANVKLATP